MNSNHTLAAVNLVNTCVGLGMTLQSSGTTDGKFVVCLVLTYLVAVLTAHYLVKIFSQ